METGAFAAIEDTEFAACAVAAGVATFAAARRGRLSAVRVPSILEPTSRSYFLRLLTSRLNHLCIIKN
jgi:hypothetical protein